MKAGVKPPPHSKLFDLVIFFLRLDQHRQIAVGIFPYR
jgi:hypothetical protein